MPISHGDQLFEMIRSLSKAEKRNFRLYARRIQGQGEHDAKFMQLFDLLEKQKEYDENTLVRKFKEVEKGKENVDNGSEDGTKSQLSNLKRHLYQHILTSLRLMEIHKNEEIQVREWIDYASILYGRGLYLQSLKLLAKAKVLAEKIKHDLLQLEIVEFEKKIESRHITRSSTERMEELMNGAKNQGENSLNIAQLSNYKLLLQRKFINHGHAMNDADRDEIIKEFQNGFPLENDDAANTFFQKIYLYQVYYWHYYLLLDYAKCQKYCEKWVELYHAEPKMIEMDVDMYMIGMHQLLIMAFLQRDHPVFNVNLEKFELFRKTHYPKLNPNSRILSFLFVHQGRFNRDFLEGSFSRGVEDTIPKTLKRIKKYDHQLDPHKVQIFYFKIAWMYLGAGKPGTAVDYLNKILNQPGKTLRDDMSIYASLLFIMAHYDLKSFDFLDYTVNNTHRAIMKQKKDSKNDQSSKDGGGPSKLQLISINFLRQLIGAAPDERIKLFQKFRNNLKELKDDPYERRSFVFLDIEAWVESKIQNKRIEEVVRERFLQRLEQAQTD
jgi:hypothetical protein